MVLVWFLSRDPRPFRACADANESTDGKDGRVQIVLDMVRPSESKRRESDVSTTWSYVGNPSTVKHEEVPAQRLVILKENPTSASANRMPSEITPRQTLCAGILQENQYGQAANPENAKDLQCKLKYGRSSIMTPPNLRCVVSGNTISLAPTNQVSSRKIPYYIDELMYCGSTDKFHP